MEDLAEQLPQRSGVLERKHLLLLLIGCPFPVLPPHLYREAVLGLWAELEEMPEEALADLIDAQLLDFLPTALDTFLRCIEAIIPARSFRGDKLSRRCIPLEDGTRGARRARP